MGGESSTGGKGDLYVAEYKLNYLQPFGSHQEWASYLQNNLLKTSWFKKDDKSSEGGETIYEVNDFEIENQQAIYVAVKVEFDKFRQTYWVYLAIPASKIGAADDPKVLSRFTELCGDRDKNNVCTGRR